jgi:hypothetical protein
VRFGVNSGGSPAKLGAVRLAATGVNMGISGGRFQGHWFKLAADDSIPLEGIDHDDGQANLNARVTSHHASSFQQNLTRSAARSPSPTTAPAAAQPSIVPLSCRIGRTRSWSPRSSTTTSARPARRSTRRGVAMKLCRNVWSGSQRLCPIFHVGAEIFRRASKLAGLMIRQAGRTRRATSRLHPCLPRSSWSELRET